jgi:hypothetical protein
MTTPDASIPGPGFIMSPDNSDHPSARPQDWIEARPGAEATIPPHSADYPSRLFNSLQELTGTSKSIEVTLVGGSNSSLGINHSQGINFLTGWQPEINIPEILNEIRQNHPGVIIEQIKDNKPPIPNTIRITFTPQSSSKT